MAENTPEEIALERIKIAGETGSEELDLSGIRLTRLPSEITHLSHLKKINLDYNEINTLPKQFGKLSNLVELKLFANNFLSLPSELTELPNLTILDISENRLESFDNFQNLKSIRKLYLNHILSFRFAEEVLSLSHLESLSCVACDLEQIPLSIAALYKLRNLDLGQNSLTELPASLNTIPLTRLNVSGNQIYKIPKSLPLTLQELYLGDELRFGNNIDHFPESILSLIDLKELSLCFNPIRELPGDLSRLHKLRILDCTNTEILSIPENIGDLSSLKVARFGNNYIKTLPASLFTLKKLEKLTISGNELDELPAEIGNLENLVELYAGVFLYNEANHQLYLSDDQKTNAIRKLPKSILNLKKLRVLDLKNNLLLVPPEILSRINEPEVITNLYFKLETQDKRALNECKIAVLGQGSVGKTSLVRQLMDKQFDPDEKKTDGISIIHWKLGCDLENKNQSSSLIVNLWDFGGQEIMHATHQFFLTERSLYILVLDARLTSEENRVEYWLKIIQSFGGESPVLIVGNKIDQHPLDIDRTGLQKKYPNVLGILETSAATGAGIEELKAVIAEQVNNLPHVRDLLPESWFTVKTKLEELGRQSNFITHDKYLELCAENEVIDETSQRTLIGFLHDLGVVLHFQDDSRLEVLGILNPQWVTNGVYKILNSHTLFQNKGVLTVSMLDEILNLPEYPRGKRLFIVDMMKKFELCYDIDADKRFLVPDLLPKDEPTTDGHQNSLAFQYQYTVLPSSVITRFIVRMNEFIDELIWRAGVDLKEGSSTALVKADTEERKVFIWIGGEEHRRHDFLSKIRGQFDAIHKTISKLEVKEMVPVPGHPEADPVDYDLLLQMDHNNVEVYPVLSNGKMIIVKVHEMLNGVVRQEDRQRGNVTNVYIGGNLDGNMIIGDENAASNG